MSFTLWICGDEAQQQTSQFGLFLNIPSYPSATTTLLDLDMGASGYIRWVLLSTGDVHLQCSLLGQTTDVSMTGGSPLPTGSWNWLTGTCGRWTGGSDNKAVASAVFLSGGSQLGSTAYFNTLSHYSQLSYGCTVGVGVSLSSSYNNFPKTGGGHWSKARISSRNPSPSWATMNLLPMPSSDWSGGDGIAYNCRQSVGDQASLPDSISGDDGLAGPLGCTIVASGPYP